MEIKKVTDAAFKKYGRVISHVDVAELVAALKETPIPADVVYEPSVESLEKLPVKEELSSVIYGEMPIQIGYCNGHNKKLNALEYHRDSEINIAAEDAITCIFSAISRFLCIRSISSSNSSFVIGVICCSFFILPHLPSCPTESSK